MRILVVMKRFSSGKDQIAENFGREVRLASELQRLGSQVTVLCADQQRKERLSTKLNGMKVEIYPLSLLGAASFLRVAKKMAAESDIVFATSHPLLGLIGVLAARKSKPVIYDIRDNYETYDLINLPFLRKGTAAKVVNNHAIRNSSMATCASPALAKMAKSVKDLPTAVVPNGIDLKLYKPLQNEKCRKILGLPPKCKIVTYSGGIRGAGIDVLIQAFNLMKDNNLRLMLIGDELKKRHETTAEGSGGRIMAFGSVPYSKLLYYLNASDVLVVSYEDNSFTKVMYAPYKLMDYMALNKPIVCTDVGEMKDMLGNEGLMCTPNNPEDMALKLSKALKIKKANYRKRLKEFTWEKLGEKLNDAIITTLKGNV